LAAFSLQYLVSSAEKNQTLSLSQRIEGVIGALAFGFEDDLQEASEVAGGPAFLLEPAEVFGGKFVERASFEAAEGHGPSAELFPVGGGLGWVHGEKDMAES